MSQSQRPSSFTLLSLLLLAAMYGCYHLITPFMPAMAWALAFAVVGNPLHRFIGRKISNPHVAAGVSVSVVACILILPAWIASDLLVRQAAVAVQYWIEHEPWKNIPFREHVDIQDTLKQVSSRLPGFLKDSLNALTQLPMALFCLFFFFRDQQPMMSYLRSWLPLSKGEADQLSSRISDILYATILGRLLLATIQGGLGGLMFWWLGLPTPLLWFLVMSVMALLPFIGAAIVWVPAAVYLLLNGSVVKGLVLAAWGALVVSTIDNILYPFLVGPRMQLHPLLTFFGVIGGIGWFGASGVILGPVILALTAALLEVWRRRMQHLTEAPVAPDSISQPLLEVASSESSEVSPKEEIE